jgi:hypothetical protein
MNTDLDRSIERAWKAEEFRAKSTGWGTTKQGQAVARQYQEQLADLIDAERAFGRDRAVWKALNDVPAAVMAVSSRHSGALMTTSLGTYSPLVSASVAIRVLVPIGTA